MFQEWGFLLGEIWVLLAIATALGLIAGWLIWGGRGKSGDDAALRAELDDARTRADTAEADLAACRAKAGANAAVDTDSAARLRNQLDRCHDDHSAAEARIDALETELAACYAAQTAPADAAPITAPITGNKPATLSSARDGQPDDLQKINGIGPKLERLCNSLGFWHFDQIAAWTAEEVAWVDENLEGFKGRVSRDAWVDQAKELASATGRPE